MNNILLEGIVAERTPVKLSDSNVNNVETMECGFISPEKFSKMDCSMVAMTPCLEVSSPKSCVLLEPISEFSHKKKCVVHAATPFPTGVHKFSCSNDSDSSSSEASEHLILKYRELVGIKQACELGNGRKVVEALPHWFMSPPKTCILMEPPDENLLTSSATNNWQLPRTAHTPCWKEKKETEFLGVQTVTKKSCNQGLGDSLTVVERSPVWKKPESTARTGKCPGENTLKELWTKFEAATTHGIVTMFLRSTRLLMLIKNFLTCWKRFFEMKQMRYQKFIDDSNKISISKSWCMLCKSYKSYKQENITPSSFVLFCTLHEARAIIPFAMFVLVAREK